MSKKIILFFVGIIFFSGFSLARAEVVINEIMYAPASGSNYEWVEIFNSGTTSVDLDGWRFFHGETTSGPLTLRNGSTTILQPSEYAIIAKSPSVVTDYSWLNFSGMILSASTLSLPDGADNTYIAIASDTNKTISNSVTYDTSLGGSKESGNSLQLISGSWIGAAPTPGIVNQASSTPSASPSTFPTSFGTGALSDNSDNNSSTQTTTATETKTKTVEESKITTHITGKKIVFANIPIFLQAKSLGYSKEELHYGKYFWNFGDGDSKGINLSDLNTLGGITHTYFYPGDYIVNLEYYVNPYSDLPDASDKMIVTVVPTDISISKVGDEKDFFVEITNQTNYDADISNWILGSNLKNFTFPKDTILSSKKKMTISSSLTNFTVQDKSTLKLMTPQRKVVFDYAASIVPIAQVKPIVAKPVKNIVPARNAFSIADAGGKNKSESSNDTAPKNETKIETPPPVAPVLNLGASAASSDVVKANSSNSYWPMLLSFIFIGVSAGAVYFIRRKKTVPRVGNDFKILDE